MSLWTRRDVLAAMGLSVASCGGASRVGRKLAGPRSDHDLLLDLLRRAHQHLDDAFVFCRRRDALGIWRDDSDAGFDLIEDDDIVIGGRYGALPLRFAARSDTAENLESQLVEFLQTRPPLRTPTPLALPKERIAKSVRGDERLHLKSRRALRDALESMTATASEVGSSRIVSRLINLSLIDSEYFFVSANSHERARSQHSRSEVRFAAWTGSELATESRVRAEGVGEIVPMGQALMQEAAEGALAHLHARSAPRGRMQVLLSPQCAAYLILHGIAALSAQGYRLPGKEGLQLIDDPTIGFGNAPLFSADKASADRASAHDLIGGLSLREARRARQLDSIGRERCLPTHVEVRGPGVSIGELIDRVEEGVLIEGPVQIAISPSGSQAGPSALFIASRGQELKQGRRTGRMFARLSLRISLAEFIAQTEGLGTQLETVTHIADGWPSSCRAPAWLSVGEVAAA